MRLRGYILRFGEKTQKRHGCGNTNKVIKYYCGEETHRIRNLFKMINHLFRLGKFHKWIVAEKIFKQKIFAETIKIKIKSAVK